jgi:hypothetical protein
MSTFRYRTSHGCCCSFSTPLVPLCEPLTDLFLRMAVTVQWDRGDGTSS